MFLTKLMLDAQCCYKRQLKDDYSVHSLVYSLFPTSETFARDFLYADKGNASSKRIILVLSRTEPNVPDDISSQTIIVSDNFLNLGEYRFEVLLNPVTTDNKTKKRMPIIGQFPLMKWFIRQQVKWGFEADEQKLEVFVKQSRTITQKGKNCVFHSVIFKGIMKVTDQSLFLQSFEKGIGHGKAFGFGLLQLSPIRQ